MRNSFGASKNMKRLKDGWKGKYHKRDQVASKLLLFGSFLRLSIEYCSALELLPAATKLGQGNIFTPVCDSVNGGGYLVWSRGGPGRHPPGPDTPPRTRHPRDQTPQTRHPLDQTPPGPDTLPDQTPPDQTPPGPDTPRTTPPWTTPPGSSRLRNTVYERPVRILLECILVYVEVHKTKTKQ